MSREKDKLIYLVFTYGVKKIIEITKAVKAEEVRSESGDDGTETQSCPPVRCPGIAISQAVTPLSNLEINN